MKTAPSRASPAQAGWFSPRPLPVATEDPALSRGPDKVVMWSYPIIRNGLICVIDIRNGWPPGPVHHPHSRALWRYGTHGP